MKRAFLLCLLSLSLAAHADEASQREARALVDALQMDKQLEGMSAAMSQAMTREMGNMGGNPRVGNIFMTEAMNVLKERALRPGGMIDTATNAYAETFSADELREIRRFYESPTGRKIIEKTPELMGRVMQQSMAMSRAAMPEICSRAKARLQDEGLQTEASAVRCNNFGGPGAPPPPQSRPSAPPQGMR
jgi:Uncharacterized protein conserved in bacteria